MSTFFERLKEFMIQQESIEDACGYYHTILQQKDSIQEIISDNEKYEFEFRYEQTIDNDMGENYYNPGKIELFLHNKCTEGSDEPYWVNLLNHHYTISLLIDERSWGYCQCSAEDKDYNYKHRCCGNGCDWNAPKISVIKHDNLAYESFQGAEHDLWKLQEAWNESSEVLEEKKRLEQIKYYEDQIAYWMKQRDTYLIEIK